MVSWEVFGRKPCALSAAASAIASGQAIPVSWRTDIADAGRGLEMAVSGPSHEWDKKDT